MSKPDLIQSILPLQPETLADADAFASWLLEEGECPSGTGAAAFQYAVCQCHDTFVWGKRIAGVWEWASDSSVDAGVRPPYKRTLLEARVFGPTAETLVWRDEKAGSSSFYGRVVKDMPGTVYLQRRANFQPAHDNEKAETEMAEWGRVSATKHRAFVRRSLGNGRITVTPRGTSVLVYEYLQEQPETGMVRIFLTRFVKILTEEDAR